MKRNFFGAYFKIANVEMMVWLLMIKIMHIYSEKEKMKQKEMQNELKKSIKNINDGSKAHVEGENPIHKKIKVNKGVVV